MRTNILKAVAEQTRLSILTVLSKKTVCACEIPSLVKRAQPAVSQHLKVLLNFGLVNMKKEGTRRMYSLSKKGKRVLSDISRW